MTRYAGIVYHSLEGYLLHLLLQEAYVRVWMVDVSARVMLSQVFENTSDSPTSRAKYVFPLPPSASICAFELEHADGRIISGIAKEKSEATQTFHGARESAGLGQLFTISVGSIPARKQVTVRLTFVMDLLDEGRHDHVCLRLPMSIAKPYGETPAAMLTTVERTRVQITVDVQTSGVIQDVHSPTHHISSDPYRTRTGAKAERRMTATWLSATFLDRDFVLSVRAHGLNEPRCFAEVHTQHADTIAMQLSLVPEFEMPRVASQEYIFVVDCSSSMSGAPIETTKRTLEVLLRLLPDADTTFNIFSFASEVDGTWETSVPFNERNMRDAILNIRDMGANDSGMGFARALQLAVASRNRNRPTVIFVLTGGHIGASPTQRKGMFAWCQRAVRRVLSGVKRLRLSSYLNSFTNLDPFEVVSAAVDSCGPNAPLRVFTLGIGEHVASALCERLARSGRGECLYAVQAEDVIERCARLLNAGRTCVIESITVDWHGPGTLLAVNFPPSDYRSLPQLEPPPLIQQVPHSITKTFPETRFSIFAITAFRSIPPEVRVRAKIEGLAEVLELVVPVTVVKQPFKDGLPLLHTLAARELIRHLVEGRTPLPRSVALATSEEVRKAAVVRLALEYKLVSPYTSFVDIESRGARASPWERSQQHYSVSSSSVTSDAAGDYALGMDATAVQTVLDNLSRAADVVFSFYQATRTQSRRQRLLPDTSARSRSSSPSSQSACPFLHDHSSTDTFSTLSSLEGSSTASQCTDSLSSSPSGDTIRRIPSPSFNSTCTARPPRRTTAPGARPPPMPTEIYALIMLQGADGSFASSSELEALVGVEIHRHELGVDRTVWATAVVVAYLRRRLGARPDLLHALLSKPLAYGRGKGQGLPGGRRFSELVVAAGTYVG